MQRRSHVATVPRRTASPAGAFQSVAQSPLDGLLEVADVGVGDARPRVLAGASAMAFS